MPYGFRAEVWGDYACFSRPELKVERVSYEVMTPSAARGLIEAVLWKPAITYIIDQIDVCAPIVFENIRRNEVNSKILHSSIENAERKLSENELYLNASADRAQRAAMVLRDVRYVIHFHFEMTDKASVEDSEEKFAAMLGRRLEKGQNYHTPYLGVREFPANIRRIHDGELQPEPIAESRLLGLMLYDIDYVTETDNKGREVVTAFHPSYFWAEMKNGVIDLRGAEVLR